MHGFRKTDAVLASILFGIAFVVYQQTSTMLWWGDSAELAAAAQFLHPVHPPGYPTYLFLGHLMTLVFGRWGTVVLSNVGGAGVVMLTYVMARAIKIGWPSALLAAALTIGAPALWEISTVTEVYSVATCALFGTLLLLMRGMWATATLLATLSMGLHYQNGPLFAIAFVMMAWARRDAFGWRDLGRSMLAGVCGVLMLISAMMIIGVVSAKYHPGRDLTKINDLIYVMRGSTNGALFHWPDALHALDVLHWVTVGQWWAFVPAVALGAMIAWQTGTFRRVLVLQWVWTVVFFGGFTVPDWNTFFLPAVPIGAIFLALGTDWLVQRGAARYPWVGYVPLLPLLAIPSHLSVLAPLLKRGEDVQPLHGARAVLAMIPSDSLVIRTGVNYDEWLAMMPIWNLLMNGERADVAWAWFLPPAPPDRPVVLWRPTNG